MIGRLAAVAPDRPPQDRSERLEAIIHNTAVEWALWCRSRRLYGSPHPVGSIMEAWIRVPGRSGTGRDARCDPDLAKFHLAVVRSPDLRGRLLFELQYREKVNVSKYAEQIGLSRRHWYRIVNAFARYAYRTAVDESY